MTILADDLTAAVDELAPADCPLMLHVSLRSFRTPLAGGADTLLNALLTRGRTVLVPTFTEPQFGLPAPPPPCGPRETVSTMTSSPWNRHCRKAPPTPPAAASSTLVSACSRRL